MTFRALLAAVFAALSFAASAQQPIKIGMSMPQTGPLGGGGKAALLALQMWVEDVNAKVGPGNPLATVLAASGFVNQRELGDAARIKVERILSDVIAYTSGTFEIEEGVLPKGAVDLKLSTERLLLAAVGRMSDRTFVLRHLESLGVVLATASDADARLGEIRAEAQPLIERLDGRRSLKEALALTRLDEFEGAKLACSLLFLGLVTRAAPGASDGAKAGDDDLDLAATARSAFGEGPEAVSFAALLVSKSV